MLRRLSALFAAVGLTLLLALPTSAGYGGGGGDFYRVHRLVSDGGVHAQSTDPNLVNGWGLSRSPTSPWWVADNGTNLSTLYDGDGNTLGLVVTVGGGPTGTVFNGSSGFVVQHGSASAPSVFLFASEDGKLRGWNPGVGTGTKAYVIASRSGVGASYKGLTIGSVQGNPYLYATDFANGRVDVFNGNNQIQHWAGAFRDPSLPVGYSPFGIQANGKRIYVTYAFREPGGDEEMAGAGLGIVDKYRMNGHFVGRVATGGWLNAPWGLAKAPSNFGKFSNDLLVGNFGDGKIHAYKRANGQWWPDGTLKTHRGMPVHVDGLWAIAFGNDAGAGPSNVLYFAAGPRDESAGLFGAISVRS